MNKLDDIDLSEYESISVTEGKTIFLSNTEDCKRILNLTDEDVRKVNDAVWGFVTSKTGYVVPRIGTNEFSYRYWRY